LNIQQLEYVIAVDRFKNFTRAAEHCYVTQATLRAMIQKLEVELGIILFERTPKQTYTTRAGLEIIEEAKKIILHTQLLTAKAKKIKGNIAGDIKIGIIPTIADSLFPKILKPLVEVYPDLKLEIAALASDQIITQLKAGHIDLGILATPITAPELNKLVLFHESFMVYGDVSMDKQYILPEEVRERKVWLFEEGHCLRAQSIQLCSLENAQETEENLKHEASSTFDSLLNKVDDFGGFTIIPELYFQSLSEDRQRRVTPFNAPVPVREMSIVFHKSNAKGRIIKALADLIRSNINETLRSYHVPEKELDVISF
jgi:LysR family hydrogen peroxide-inducible transcriptional activator